MAQPIWTTPAGLLPSPYTLSVSLVAPATAYAFSLVTGDLPPGMTLLATSLAGTPNPVNTTTSYRFTLRVTDNLANFRDRSFIITVVANAAPVLTLPSYSNLFTTPDSTWVEQQIGYTDPTGGKPVFVITSGSLPPGLEMDPDGLIRGYPSIVTIDTITQFTIQATGVGGVATAIYTITVQPPALRPPELLNSRPGQFVPSPGDPYSAYYTSTGTITFTSDITTTSTSSYIGSISGNVLSVTAILTNAPSVGELLSGTGIADGTMILEITQPATAYAIVSITSTAVDFTVVLTAVPPTWIVGTTITIDSTVPAAYNADWIIASVAGATITVNTPLNPGASTTNGTARSFGTNVLGLYTVNVNQIAAPTTVTGFTSTMNVTAISGGNLTVGMSFSGTSTSVVAATALVPGSIYTIDTLGTTNFATVGAASGTVNATLNGYNMTVTSVVTGSIAPGQNVSGTATSNTLSGSFIVGQLYTITAVGGTDFVALGAGSSVVGGVFTATGTGQYTAPNIIVGLTYTILSLGTTDWTLVGAATNTIGTTFVATGVGSGSGIARQGSGTAVATIPNGAQIIGYGTGTGGTGSYTLNVSSVGGSIIGTGWTLTPGVGQEFTATAVGAGTGTVLPTIPSGTTIVEYGTATGGTGTYLVNRALNVPSTTVTVAKTLGTSYWGDYFAFKLIGVDYNNPPRPLIYSAVGLPTGLILDPTTGWITGTVVQPIGVTSTVYTWVSWVVNDLGQSSTKYTYSITLSDGQPTVVSWTGSSTLPTLNVGDICNWSVSAVAATTLQYRVVGGSLPPNLTMNTDGTIWGRVAWEPGNAFTAPFSTTNFTFTVEAYDPLNPVSRSSTRQYTAPVYKRFRVPHEDVYLMGTPDIEDRTALNTLLSNTIIPDNLLYRPNDPYWGRATGVTYTHTFGVSSDSLSDYLTAITKNFYNRQITLGPLRTAVAQDTNGVVQYEVVYSEIVDDLNNSSGVSVSKQITWPYTVTTSDGLTTTTLYPASLFNMREQLVSTIGVLTTNQTLPLWMTCQQPNGNQLGYVAAWVICYTKPGQSDTVINRIQTLWNYQLNKINFTVDRITIDKAATYDWDSLSATWAKYPSAQSCTVTITDTNALTSPVNQITASPPTVTNNISNWYIGMPLKFVGTPFGGLQEDLVYYVSSINPTTNTFSVSTSLTTQTVILYTASGSMVATPLYPQPKPTDSKDIYVLFDRPNILSR